MQQASLNLARKWRSAQFSEIVGQDLVVRILQNSLFKNQFFPVYLLSGQRGCGKTSTARVFAAAVNCSKLPEFQKNPKIQIPCLTCSSCEATSRGQHPDFIEIDAASYTGVDNIRNIIDTSSFLPVLGQRKIYLIDEVHMLSKAAFNALLKILEEPSKSVLFILATTETQKIPDTVRSRCFQLLFNPVVELQVAQHLQRICEQEKIAYDQDGLVTIAQVTQGSLRDAINLLEQARFAESRVTKEAVIGVLGYVDDMILFEMLDAMIQANTQELLQVFERCFSKTVSIDYVLKRLLEIMYDGIVIKYGGSAKYTHHMPENMQEKLAAISTAQLIGWFDELCQLDILMAKTSKKHLLFESMVLRLILPDYQKHHLEDDKKKNKDIVETPLTSSDEIAWTQFVQMVVAHIDPVLASILYATDFVQYDRSKQIIEVVTLKKFTLFQDLFLQEKRIYQEYLNRLFGYQVTLVVSFTKIETAPVVVKAAPVHQEVAATPRSLQPKAVVAEKSVKSVPFVRRTTGNSGYVAKMDKNERSIDVSDTQKWKITHMLLQHVGGTVREIIRDTHEFDA